MDSSPSSSRGPEAEAPRPVIMPMGTPWPPSYYIEDGLRRVEPYHWTYNTYCKERWRGRTLIEVFESEFRDRTTEYYRTAMESGQIFINGKRVGPEHVLRNGDLVSHTLHRHEPPVTAEPIGIVHEDDDMIVINKPSGVPVHPAGRYKLNTVIEILKSERGPGFMPYPCNRLDRLTSGVMFVAKSVHAAEALTRKIKQRTVRKEYIARVMGEFPDGEVVCDQPILQISPKLGLNRVRADGKTARTVFKKLAYYPAPGYSVVRCLPVTGRTHQIRVHLQYLGHPIQNDPIYANQRVWGLELGRADAEGTATTDEDVISRLSRMGKQEVAQAVVYYDEMVDQYEKRRAEKMTGELCGECETPLYSDPGAHELSLWLHSLRYEDVEGSWSYVSQLPAWALPPEGVEGPTTVGGMQELVEAAREDEGEDPDMAGKQARPAEVAARTEAAKPAGAVGEEEEEEVPQQLERGGETREV
ncbi:RNA pseudouridylate synthase domain-containing protein [Hirsutella rhossiliensis]|uniref:Pseudouridine synthase n=1 Tax=Hirsutella rhossiliensis TaxID=111463 RepID=A0A9P8N5V5_9HYPO|nr:RNA pseudouridylate synthase domain-containing protein [Hirsutella rhossiliensis]KAH0967405.1 RNA pseudouridylate synthase domain-containing protein [Hirsutella rhossiliensis]